MAQSIWPSAILLPSRIAASRLVPQARCRSRPGCFRGESGAEHRLARQIPLARVLHDRARGDIVQALALQPEALDHAAQCGGQHLLIADLRVSAVAARKRNAHAADDRDAPWTGSDQHRSDSRMTNARIMNPPTGL
jgi:hypothetical protein